MGDSFVINPASLRRIDSLLPKLKYSVLPIKMIRWLEQFEEQDRKYAYDLLQVFEFINFTELQYRLEDELRDILQYLGPNKIICIIPYGKFGKSGTLVTYPISHTPTFEKYTPDITITNDIQKIDPNVDAIIFLDDFIGSGNTFITEFDEGGFSEWIDSKKISEIFLLSAVIMTEGKETIEKKHKSIKIFAQERNKIFTKGASLLESFGNQRDFLEFIEKYETRLKISKKYKMGFENSESLIAFSHGIPNNSLPLFWWGKSSWFPLYPRHSSLRMEDARTFKKEVAFYIGICNRLGIDLFSLNKNLSSRKKYNSKINHSLISLLLLKQKNTENLIICQILGLTMKELREIILRAQKEDFLDKSDELTYKGILYIKELKKSIKKENFRASSEENLKIKELVYVPLSFKGLT